jgi:hypothetical protein
MKIQINEPAAWTIIVIVISICMALEAIFG